MVEVDTLVSGSRNLLRDFPLFFEIDHGPLNVTTIRLPHPLVPAATLQVVASDDAGVMQVVPATEWKLDERNGLLKFLTADYFERRVFAAGYHYSWFLDSDLAFHANRALIDISYGQDIDELEDFSPVEIDTIEIGVVVSALWSLATELALDIDVSTPEGMYIPARQRYTQVMQMWQSWEAEMRTRMGALNLGVGRLEVFWLRRVAYLTNRLVPVYKSREVGDRRPPKRLYPEIPAGVPAADVATSVEEVGREAYDLGFGGWYSIGTQG